MRQLSLILVVLALLGSCTPAGPKSVKKTPSKPLVRTGMVGRWKGEFPEVKGASNEGAKSNFLVEQLGGFTLDLKSDNTYESNFRGMIQGGTWQRNGESVELSVTKVFGRTKDEARTLNPEDLPLFGAKVRLRVSRDGQVLTMEGSGADTEAVVFKPIG